MKRLLFLIISFITALTVPFLYAAEAAKPSGQDTILQEILILNSYHPGYAFSDDEQAGIIDVFHGKDKNWMPVVEYLDLKRLPDGKHLAELKKLFRLKYKNKKFSVVIAMDNPALEFAIDNQTELFGNAPIVFCGINNYTPSLLKGRTHVTGIAEAIDIAGTVEVMLRLHPATQLIFSPHDYTATGLAVRKELETLAPRFTKVRFRFTDPLTMEELLKDVERLPKNSLVLEIGFITDKSGRTFGMTETTKLMYEHSPVPIYSTYEQRLGFGIVGGKLLSPRIHGGNAGRITLRVLAGEKASAIPVVSESNSQFMFDYKIMSRFGIPLTALPDGSMVINKPVSFFATHREVILTALGITGFLLIIILMFIINIIQRRRSSNAIRQREELFRVIASSTPDHLLVQDTDLRYSFVMNPQLGLMEKDMIGKTDHDFLSKEDADRLTEIKRQVMNTSNPVHIEVPLISVDGEQQFFNGSYVPKFDAQGKITGLIGYFRNVTERKRAEEALHESEEEYRSLFENSVMGISRVLPDGQLISVNNTYAQMYGYANAAEMMITLSNVGQLYVNPEDRKEVLLTLREKDVMEPREITVVRRDGTHFTVLVGARAIKDSQGNLKYYQAEHVDITNRKRAEEALKLSEENFRHSLDHSPMGVRIVTEEGETIYANRAILDIYGYDSIKDLKTTPVEKRYTPESHADFLIRREKRRQGVDGPSEYTVDIIRKDGAARSLSVLRRATLWDGKRQFQVLYKDITEQKRTEEALQKSQDQLREAHRLARIGIWNWATDTGIVTWTQELYHIAGLDPTLPAPTYAEQAKIYAPESWERLKESVERSLKTGEPYQIELKLIRPDGTTRWVNAFGGAVYDSQRGIQGLQGTVQDITNRKQAEEEVKKRENLLQKIFEVLPVGLWFADKDGHLLRGNPAGVKIWGAEPKVGPAEYGVFKARRLPSGEEIEPEDWAMTHTVREGVTIVDEMLEIHSLDGRKKVILNYTAPVLNDEGAIQGAIAVNLDITEQKRTEDELRASRSQLRALADRLQQIREEERVTIAREIHDEMGGGLTGLKMELSAMQHKLGEAKAGLVTADLTARMHASSEMIDQMIRGVRRIAASLRPSVLDDLGLIAALEWQLREFTNHTQIPHEFVTSLEEVYLEESTAAAVFRIFQEAMTNVARHSGATKVSVLFREVEENLFPDNRLSLEIRDNGRGITEDEILGANSLGLLGMKERVLVFGGELTIHGKPGGGTILTLIIPQRQGNPS